MSVEPIWSGFSEGDRAGRIRTPYLEAIPAGAPFVVLSRADYEALRGIVQRVKDGWWPGEGWPGEDPDTAGLWEHADVAFDETPDPELMTEAEQIAWYGSVVREEEQS